MFDQINEGVPWDNILREDQIDLSLKVKKPTAWAVEDFFHEGMSFGFIDDFFGHIGFAKQHVFIILTKCPRRMKEYFDNRESFGESGPFPWPNVWLGVTVEHPDYLWRVKHLFRIPAAIRLVSIEPMIGPINLGFATAYIDWVICGGELGPNARPMNPDWVRSLRDQCQAARVPFFLTQLGEWVDEIHPAFNRNAQLSDEFIIPTQDKSIITVSTWPGLAAKPPAA